MSDCLFCKIADGEQTADVVYTDDDLVAFRDINPQAPTHILIIPRRHITTLNDIVDADSELLGRMNLAATELARREGITDAGFRTVFNCNEGGAVGLAHSSASSRRAPFHLAAGIKRSVALLEDSPVSRNASRAI